MATNMSKDLKVNLGRGLTLKNPITTASGTFGYGTEFKQFFDVSKLGGICTKGLSPHPRLGNPPQRIVETPSGMLNAIGLQNIGVEAFINDKLPELRKDKVTVICNIFGETLKDYEAVAKRLSEVKGVHALELNISCPNVKKGGISFGTNPKEAFKVVSKVRKATNLHIMTKLSPEAGDIKPMVKAVEEAGTDSISLINTISGMVVDVNTRKPMIKNIKGGLSGPAIRPIAVRMTWEASTVTKLPLIGVGGIANSQDALEFIIAGASAVQVGTMNFVDPDCSVKMIKGIEDYMVRHKIKRYSDLIGSIET